MKTKELLKRALKHPELFTEGELQYFQLERKRRKQQKLQKKAAKALENQSDFLI